MDALNHLFDAIARDTASIGGAGTVAGAVLLVLLRVLLPIEHRRHLKTPLILFASHLGVGLLSFLVPAHSVASRPTSLLALFLLLGSMGNGLLLLATRSYIARGWVGQTPRIIQDIAQIVVYAVAVLVTLRAAGVEPGSLITTSAVLTAVLGLSLQDTLGNIFAGLAIQAERPFSVGDWIQLDEDDRLAGKVIEVNWRATKLLTSDGIELIVPNGTLAKSAIKNYTKPTTSSRRSVKVSAPYEVPTQTVHRVIRESLAECPGILKTPPTDIQTREFGESGITYITFFWIEDFSRRHAIESAVRDHIWYAFQRSGIQIPFPIRTVLMHEQTQETVARTETKKTAMRRAVLQRVDFLANLPSSILEDLAERSQLRMYSAGELIVRQGEQGTDLFVIESGMVSVLLEEPDRSILEVSRLGAGQFFGEMSLMTGEPRRASVRAIESTSLVVLNKEALEPVLKAHPKLAETICDLLSRRKEALELSAANRSASSAKARQENTELLSRIRQFFGIG